MGVMASGGYPGADVVMYNGQAECRSAHCCHLRLKIDNLTFHDRMEEEGEQRNE